MNNRNSRVADAVAAAGVEPQIRILDADAKTAAAAAGADAIRKGEPQFVFIATGQVTGGVAPTGHPGQLRTVVDETLAHYPVIWTAAGTADSMMSLTYEELLKVTEGVELRVR